MLLQVTSCVTVKHQTKQSVAEQQTLSLASGQPDSRRTDGCVVAVGQRHDLVVNVQRRCNQLDGAVGHWGQKHKHRHKHKHMQRTATEQVTAGASDKANRRSGDSISRSAYRFDSPAADCP